MCLSRFWDVMLFGLLDFGVSMAGSFGGEGLITFVMVMSSDDESGGGVSFVFSSVGYGL